MGKKDRITPKASEVEASYFELHAYLGTTKHMGGLASTKELIELCRVGPGMFVLDVGCGPGATACYLAKQHGCRVIGVDLRESMVVRARERAKGEGLEDKVEFRVADAQDLPFDDAFFDAVLCESVATFVEDKQRVVDELARVTKPGGYVGLNEEIWLQTPPPQLVQDVKRLFAVEPKVPSADDWHKMLERAGLRDVVVETHQLETRREATQMKRYRLGDNWRMFTRTIELGLKNPGFRKYMKGRRRPPKDVFQYFGYGLFVGKK